MHARRDRQLYDNSLPPTTLGSLIATLAQRGTPTGPDLLSTGESPKRGLYLHGLPWFIVKSEATRW
jgi:hypothetical protein